VDLKSAWQLSQMLRTWQPDVIHAHEPHGVSVAALALSFAGGETRPALVASRRVDFHVRDNAFSRWKYRQVACFIAASRAIGDMLAEDGIGPERIVVVHDGVDIERVRQAPTANIYAEFHVPSGAPVVGNIAALVEHKGQKHLIDAAAIVCRRVPDARFVILGEGELRPALERQVKEVGLEKHVLLPGFRTDALSLLKAFDLFVMSSVTEGLGTSLLDAMAASRAVVATRAGGMPEVVLSGETGFIVPARDSEALAGAIVQLLKDQEMRERFALAGFERVRALFSADRMVDETIAVYERSAGRDREGDSAHHAADA
jgi:glycosyltransferase involved in cell wall biosynthesis